MSSVAGSSEREADQKVPVTSTSRELPREYELDGIDDLNDDYHGHVGYTHNDKSDMHRMGKVQELKVR